VQGNLQNLGPCQPSAMNAQLGSRFDSSNSSITSQGAGSGQSHDHTLSANFSGSANSVLQPTLVLNYIIKT
jgi:hypothetical protein